MTPPIRSEKKRARVDSEFEFKTNNLDATDNQYSNDKFETSSQSQSQSQSQSLSQSQSQPQFKRAGTITGAVKVDLYHQHQHENAKTNGNEFNLNLNQTQYRGHRSSSTPVPLSLSAKKAPNTNNSNFFISDNPPTADSPSATRLFRGDSLDSGSSSLGFDLPLPTTPPSTKKITSKSPEESYDNYICSQATEVMDDSSDAMEGINNFDMSHDLDDGSNNNDLHLTSKSVLFTSAVDDVSPNEVVSFPPATPNKQDYQLHCFNQDYGAGHSTPHVNGGIMSRTIANNKSNNIRNSNSDNSMNEMGTPPRNTIEHSVTATPNKSSLSNNNNNNNNNSNNNSIDEIGNNHAGRFTTDFAILSTLGSGSFGSVHKCQSRLDNCVYAIKAAKRPWKGNAGRDKALKEVYALAALSDVGNEHGFHIVRYHNAWMEDDRLFIQTELCDTSLEKVLKQWPEQMRDMNRRYTLLREMLLALELLHKSNLVHLDIKPDNIFLKSGQFKLGDFGLVNMARSNARDVEEGDSRYMSLELLNDDHNNLTKSDIFSLGATLYEVCLGRDLPCDGPEWQQIRNGQLMMLQDTPNEFAGVIAKMMSPNAHDRPAAEVLLQNRQLLSESEKKLQIEKNHVAQLNSAMQQQQQMFRNVQMSSNAGGITNRLQRSNTWDPASTMARRHSNF